jgi:alkaline phosphatase
MKNKNKIPLLVTALVFLAISSLPGCSATPKSTIDAAPKVVLFIGDGMDDQQITIARTYIAGSRGRLSMDSMPFRGSVRVLGVSEDDPTQFIYVTDSASSGTAMSTGVRTSFARIATTASSDADLTTIMEMASAAGMATGIVTTASVTDATPASFVAHSNHRWCQGPDSMSGEYERMPILNFDCEYRSKANGGPGSIAEQLSVSGLDLLLGGGTKHFEQPVEASDASNVLDLARSSGFSVAFNRGDLLKLSDARRVLGLFAEDTMPVMLRGVGNAKAAPITRDDGEIQEPVSFSCEPNPDFSGMPTLAEMTGFALDHMPEAGSFVLMIESASIDKQSHVRQPCGHIGELGQLDEAVALALAYSERHPETLVLVTADHAHIAHIIFEPNFLASTGFSSPGHVARVNTPEGGTIRINYAGTDFPVQDGHSGAQVPLLASGPGASDLPIFLEQTDIFEIMSNYLNLAQ